MKTCIACGSALRSRGMSGGMEILQCSVCGLGVTAGLEQAESTAYHRDAVYVSEQQQFKNIFKKRVELLTRFKNQGKALEVGSSTGLFLSLLKKQGWEVYGIEPSELAAETALKRGILTQITTFEKAKLSSRDFDVVMFNHVLEHMDNPRSVLQKTSKVLHRGGLVFIDVPNFASLTARFSGVGWRYILPQEHRWHFTPSALFTLLEDSGFAILYWEAHSGIWGYGDPLQELWESFVGGKKRFVWNLLTALPTWLLTTLKAGTGLTVIAQKVD